MKLDILTLSLSHTEWLAILAALDGDRSSVETAYDALFRQAPQQWCDQLPDADEPLS